MTRYVLFLRGINVGGKNQVKMEDLKAQLRELGFADVVSYINSGNLIFASEKDADEVKSALRQMFADRYEFEILFALIRAGDYQETVEALPGWWKDGSLARRDALFFTDEVESTDAAARIRLMKLYNEIVHETGIAVFWGKIDEKEYAKTAYHKSLIKEDFYKKVTIRNGNTVEKMAQMLRVADQAAGE